MKKALLIAPMSSVLEKFSNANFAALEANGFEVSVISNFSRRDRDKQYKKELEDKGITVYERGFVRASLLKNSLDTQQSMISQGRISSNDRFLVV